MSLVKKSFGGRNRKLVPTPDLNLTPMIDTLIVLLIFLVKSYSVTPEYLTPTQGIELSRTTSKQGAPDKPALIIGKDGILFNGVVLIAFKDGVPARDFSKDPFIPELKERLDKIKGDDTDFSGTLILQADKSIPFHVLRPILRTAGVSGFYDIKFAGSGAE
jgi:biopolymer transport protein ExbD